MPSDTTTVMIKKTLDDLLPGHLKEFQFYLREYTKSKRKPIPWGKLEGKDRIDTAKLLTDHYGKEESLQVTVQTLKEIGQLNLACQLEENMSK